MIFLLRQLNVDVFTCLNFYLLRWSALRCGPCLSDVHWTSSTINRYSTHYSPIFRLADKNLFCVKFIQYLTALVIEKADSHHPDQLLLSSDQLFLPYKNHANFASKVGQKILTNSPDQLLTNFGAKTYDILHEVMTPPKLQKTLETCVFPAFYRVLYARHAPLHSANCLRQYCFMSGHGCRRILVQKGTI